MKKTRSVLTVMLALAMLLTLCTGCNRGRPEFDEGSIFNKIIFHQKYMELEGLDMGMSLKRLMKMEGLTEDNASIAEDTTERTTYVTANEPIYFNEAGPYPVTRMYTLKNGGLVNVSYFVPYAGTDYDQAFTDAKAFFNEISKYAGSNFKQMGNEADVKKGRADSSYMGFWALGSRTLMMTINNTEDGLSTTLSFLFK